MSLMKTFNGYEICDQEARDSIGEIKHDLSQIDASRFGALPLEGGALTGDLIVPNVTVTGKITSENKSETLKGIGITIGTEEAPKTGEPWTIYVQMLPE